MENVKLFTLVSQINDLPGFPEIAYRIINEIDDINTDAKKLTDIILLDPALTLKIINIANSAYYSPRNEITNVTYAISYLGFNTIKSISYTNAVQVLKSKDKNNLLVSRFQEKSIVSALVCRMLVDRLVRFDRKSKVNPEIFYIYGLFHNIGELVVSIYYPEIMKEIISKVSEGANIVDVEGKLKHSQIGLMIMRKWNLPENYAQMCSKHHVFDLEKLPDDNALFINDIMLIADAVTYELGYNPTFNTNLDVDQSIYRIGMRNNDIFGDDGILIEAEMSIESQLTFLT